MSKAVKIGSGPEAIVNDSVYDNIDWGSSSDDFVHFVTESGGFVLFAWANTLSVVASGVDPGPDTFPGYTITVRGELNHHISEATKEAIEAELSGPGSQDKIISFVTTRGDDIHLATANIQELVISPTTLVIEP